MIPVRDFPLPIQANHGIVDDIEQIMMDKRGRQFVSNAVSQVANNQPQSKNDQIISRVIKDYIYKISELIPFYFDANYRLLKIHLLVKDLLILLCQDKS